MNASKVGFIGLGEVGYYMGRGLREAGVKEVYAYNRQSQLYWAKAIDSGIIQAGSLEELIHSSEILISAVPGAQASLVSKHASAYTQPGQLYVDLTNSSPMAKQDGAKAVQASGASFADVMLQDSPQNQGAKCRMTAAGNGAEAFQNFGKRYNIPISVIPGEAGTAAMIKIAAQILNKGMQALLWEALLLLHKTGPPLWEHYPPIVVGTIEADQSLRAEWMIPHAAIHAKRKSEELLEVAETLRHYGVDPLVVSAASERLLRCEAYGLKERFNGKVPEGGYRAILEVLKELPLDLK